MKDLTDRQRKIYDWIMKHRRYVLPAPMDIANRFGITRSGANYVVKAIRKKGYDFQGGEDGDYHT